MQQIRDSLQEKNRFGFNPHPSRRTGATDKEYWESMPDEFQSSPVPKDGCNQRTTISLCAPRPVSILTRPEGRVQPASPSRNPPCYRFNPHPSRRTGATSPAGLPTQVCGLFQSSPVPKDGCNAEKHCKIQHFRSFCLVPFATFACYHPLCFHHASFLPICQVIWLTSMPANLTLGA